MTHSGLSYNAQGTVSGVFFSKADADRAYNTLLEMGHSHDDISVLMSDETLNRYERPHPEDASEFVTSEEQINVESQDKKPGSFVSAIVSITSMIPMPGLGIAISQTFLKRLYELTGEKDTSTINDIIGARVPELHRESYGDSMNEGGIIISVDPRNRDEKKSIVKAFRAFGGRDILSDDGYTEL